MKTINLPSSTVQAQALEEEASGDPVGYFNPSSVDYLSPLLPNDGLNVRLGFPTPLLANGMERVEPGYLKVPVDGIYSIDGNLAVERDNMGRTASPYGGVYRTTLGVGYPSSVNYTSGAAVRLVQTSGPADEKSGFEEQSDLKTVVNKRHKSIPRIQDMISYSFSGEIESLATPGYDPWEVYVTINGSQVSASAYFMENVGTSGDRKFSVSGEAKVSLSPNDSIQLWIKEHTYSSGTGRGVFLSDGAFSIVRQQPYEHTLEIFAKVYLPGGGSVWVSVASNTQSVWSENFTPSSLIPLKAGMEIAFSYRSESPLVSADPEFVKLIRGGVTVKKMGEYEDWPYWAPYGL